MEFTQEEAAALFLLAEIRVRSIHRLENQYWPEAYTDLRRDSPWFLMDTELGLVKLGWRKRVLSIDWGSTSIRCIVTEDDVTKSETMVHAWSYPKALDYLIALKLMSAPPLEAP